MNFETVSSNVMMQELINIFKNFQHFINKIKG